MHRVEPEDLGIGSRFAVVAAALLPLLVLLAVLARTVVLMPIVDDYQAMLGFALELRTKPTLWAHLLYDVTAQSGEYRIMLIHLLVDAQLALVHHIALAPFIWSGNLVFLPMLLVWWVNFHPCAGHSGIAQTPLPPFRRLLLFLPVIYLTCNLVYVEQLNWSAGLLYFCVPISLGAIHCLLQSTHGERAGYFAAALTLLVLGCLTSPNSYLVAPIGLAILSTQKRLHWPRLAAWCAAPVLCAALYLYHYQGVTHIVRMNLAGRVGFFLSFLGGAFENLHQRPVPYAAVAVGTLLLAVFGYAVYRRVYREQPFLFYAAVWVLLTDAMVDHIRGDIGFLQSLTVRYKIYSVQMLLFCYVYLLGHVQQKRRGSPTTGQRFWAVSLASAVLFTMAADVLGYRLLEIRKQELLAGLAWYRQDPAQHSPLQHTGDPNTLAPGHAELARANLLQAVTSGLFHLPGNPPSAKHPGRIGEQ